MSTYKGYRFGVSVLKITLFFFSTAVFSLGFSPMSKCVFLLPIRDRTSTGFLHASLTTDRCKIFTGGRKFMIKVPVVSSVHASWSLFVVKEENVFDVPLNTPLPYTNVGPWIGPVLLSPHYQRQVPLFTERIILSTKDWTGWLNKMDRDVTTMSLRSWSLSEGPWETNTQSSCPVTTLD